MCTFSEDSEISLKINALLWSMERQEESEKYWSFGAGMMVLVLLLQGKYPSQR